MSEIKKYDRVLCWGLVEELVLGVVNQAEIVNLKPQTEIPIAEIVKCLGKRVLIVGSYFSSDSIRVLSAATTADVLVFSEADLKKYTESERVQLAPWVHPKNSSFIIPDAPEWTMHLLRRTRGKSAGETPDDEAFYRGMLLIGSEKGLNVEATIQAMFKGELVSEQALIDLGHMVQRVSEYHARENVEFSGKLIKVGKYSARIVSASVVPVMPMVMEAAKGVDIGISQRYNQKEGTTQVTFYTLTPDKVDLGFVHEKPFEGGGRPDCKGKTFKGIVDIAELCKQVAMSS